MDNLESIFTKIYSDNLWGGGSGYGSKLEYNVNFISFLSNWIGKNNIKSIVDLGCGDMQWMPYVINNIKDLDYLGIDTVDDLIETNKLKYPEFRFITHNIIDINWEVIPKFDLYFIKDVLQHWPSNYIEKWLNNFFLNNEEIMIVNCDLDNIRKNPIWKDHTSDRDMEIGDFRPLSKNHYPLSLYNTEEVFSYDTKKVYIVKK